MRQENVLYTGIIFFHEVFMHLILTSCTDRWFKFGRRFATYDLVDPNILRNQNGQKRQTLLHSSRLGRLADWLMAAKSFFFYALGNLTCLFSYKAMEYTSILSIQLFSD